MSNLYEINEENEPLSRFDDVESDNVLSQLKAVVGKKVMRPEVFISVPERPGVQILVSPNITQQQLRAWQKNAGSETKNGVDATKFACQVIGHTTIGIYLNGEEVFEDGRSLGFASPSILKMTGATRALPDAVIAFFGLDPHVEAAALAIIDAAGYGDSVEQTENPTKLS
jgi:hypothetical protein